MPSNPILLPLAILTLLGPAAANTTSAPDGFIPLFDGHSLEGWWGSDTQDPTHWQALSSEELTTKRNASLTNINTHWSIQNGELLNDGKGLNLTTNKHFTDFELRLEYRITPGTESGIFLKGCPLIQIWDHTDKSKFQNGANNGSGGLRHNDPNSIGKIPLTHADNPVGQWNAMRIIQCGSRTWVWLNDTLVVDGAIFENTFNQNNPIPPSGPIQLQAHGGETRWRNIHLREINATEANQRLREINPDSFTPLFNGVDLNGWQGAVDAYEIIDDSIACKPGKGGTLFTSREYHNFTARLEFKLPPGGNNGLAIRYPGQGDPAYSGMCEIQILDDTAEKYHNLDPRQYNGSIYGMIPSHTGYLRPTGQWNHMEVTVMNTTIHVELNGTIITSGNLSTINDFLNDKNHPGKDRTHGAFGLAGHNDPVMFRNISIKELHTH